MVNMTHDLNDTIPVQLAPASFDAIVRGRRRDDARPATRPTLRQIVTMRSTARHAKPLHSALRDKLAAFGLGVRAGTLTAVSFLLLAASVAWGAK